MNKQLATLTLIESHVNKAAKGTGKPYSATVLHYKVGDENKEKMIVDRNMRDHIVNNFHSGDTVVMTWEKNEKGYLDLVAMEQDNGSYKPEATTSTSNTYRGSTNDREIGMQVGNALTNATTLMASGQSKNSLEETAEEIIRVGERLKAKMLAGEL
jgi:hypothetical protein